MKQAHRPIGCLSFGDPDPYKLTWSPEENGPIWRGNSWGSPLGFMLTCRGVHVLGVESLSILFNHLIVLSNKPDRFSLGLPEVCWKGSDPCV